MSVQIKCILVIVICQTVVSCSIPATYRPDWTSVKTRANIYLGLKLKTNKATANERKTKLNFSKQHHNMSGKNQTNCLRTGE